MKFLRKRKRLRIFYICQKAGAETLTQSFTETASFESESRKYRSQHHCQGMTETKSVSCPTSSHAFCFCGCFIITLQKIKQPDSDSQRITECLYSQLLRLCFCSFPRAQSTVSSSFHPGVYPGSRNIALSKKTEISQIYFVRIIANIYNKF